jgi:hypothetical protein
MIRDRQLDCTPVGMHTENGQIVMVDVVINKGGSDYLLSVATPQYRQAILSSNASLPEDQQVDTNIYLLQPPLTLDSVCRSISQTPPHKLIPFMTKLRSNLS